MSSSRQNSGRVSAIRLGRRPRATSAKGSRSLTLRAKLIAGIVGIIVVVCVALGIVTEYFLSKYLVAQEDQRLMSYMSIINPDAKEGPVISLAGIPGDFLSCATGFRQNDDSLNATIAGGVLTSVIVRSSPASCRSVSPDDAAALLTVDPSNRNAVTVKVGDEEYRVAARALPSGFTVVHGQSLKDVSAIQMRLGIIMAAVAGGAILVGAGAVFWIVRRSVRPLERVAATARKVSTLPLDRGEVDLDIRVPDADTNPRTEIGQVGAALNQMLSHVSSALESRHASETRVRQFVADASHELRTPLTAIRGYAELARRGEPDPAAVTHALRRVESESARMTTLVDDLLLLARLDSGRPLESAEVDLTMLVVDRVSDAQVAGPDHRWQLDLPEEPVLVTGDAQRLHQVLANLLANARNHTPPGTLIVISLRGDDRGATLTVTDDGPGIPPALQPEIFGRFVRGDSSRSRAAGSTGLGLAIVAAVISAHHGAVGVQSRPGRTEARVWLPSPVTPAAPVAPRNLLKEKALTRT